MPIYLETKRLILRPLKKQDFDDLLSLQSDPDVMRYIGHGVRTAQQVQELLQRSIKHWEKQGFGLCAVIGKCSQNFIGRAGIIQLGLDENNSDVEIAFALKKDYWSHGYGQELASALLAKWFEKSSHQKVLSVVRMENEASVALLKKLGMNFVNYITYDDIPNVACFEISRARHLDLNS